MGTVKKKIRCGGRPMTAIVLAGGRGRRMKADKAGLDVGGQTLLEHVLGQIGPHFDEVLVSITPGQTLAPVPGVRTSTPLGRTPLLVRRPRRSALSRTRNPASDPSAASSPD